jgi:FtsP/CotA-like multicopper oxidase with cupredoxin domain
MNPLPPSRKEEIIPECRTNKGDQRLPKPPVAEAHLAHAGGVTEHPPPTSIIEGMQAAQSRGRASDCPCDRTGTEKFKIGSARAKRQQLTPDQWNNVVQEAINSSSQFGEADSPLLCAHAGTTETWTVVNWPFHDNQENHNFHIHQTKFEFVDVQDPHGRITPPRGGNPAKRLVDNYPAPIGGSIRLRVRFLQTQAGGRVVLHCHILEHEEKGMMAAIEVLPR